MKFSSFRDMPVWQQAMELSVEIFNLTVSLPKSEDYGLTSQIRRSAGSVHANIAEGFGRNSPADKNRFYVIANGSCSETQSHLIYAEKVNYFDPEKVSDLIGQYQTLIHDLNKLIKSFKS